MQCLLEDFKWNNSKPFRSVSIEIPSGKASPSVIGKKFKRS